MKNKDIRVFSRMYLKISVIFLLVLILFTSISIYVYVQSAREYSIEVNQKLNRNLAANTTDVIKPFLEEGEINEKAIEELVHSMMIINPSIEIYLLDTEGNILSYVAPYKEVKLNKVSLDPIYSFINDKEQNIIYGDDPRNPGEVRTFSAAEVIQDNQLIGYLYIVLASQEYVSASQMVLGSYIMSLSIKSIIIILVISALVGLMALWLIVKHLNVIIRSIKQFQSGNLKTRIPIKKEDELNLIGVVFNDMAETIEKNIEKLKGIDKLRKELIGNISHDLRTPVASIQGYAETLILKKDQLLPEQREKYLNIIYKSCERLKKLVADLFELSKLQSNQVTLHIEPFSVAELVHDVANKYRLISKKKGININTVISKNTPVVEADISLIERVLQNLMDNAIRFCNEGDTVTIVIDPEDPEHVRIRIADTGEGISTDMLPHIFERYYKSGEYKHSTGLGLAIVKNIIDLHGTSIQVESVPGKGTSFYFSLPVAQLA